MNVKKRFTVNNVLIIIFICVGIATVLLLTKLYNPKDKPNKLQDEQSKIAIRSIGDDLLKSVGNYNDPIPPIKKVDSITLRLELKRTMMIVPDSLVAISLKHLKKSITPRAVVNVLDAKNKTTVYTYEINHLENNNIPCLGRVLPESNYWIDVSFFRGANKISEGTIAILGGGFVLIFSVLLFFSKGINKQKRDNHYIIKGYKIIPDFNTIVFNGEAIQLTEKEMHIFNILIESEGELVTREYLTEEVWLKKGVVTSRSLDMYISRLRKKIKKISHTEILNHRGKGYVFKV